MKKSAIFLLVFAVAFLVAKPKLTVMLVIDQFAADYIPKLRVHLTHGIGRLLDNAIVYEQAFYPHAVLETAVGHASLGTGAIPAGHGIVANSWLDQYNKDHALTAKNADEIMAKTFMYKFLKQKNNYAVALSIKDRAAVGMAGSNAPAIYLDQIDGEFKVTKTTSVITDILKAANKKIAQPYQTRWQLAYEDEKFYNFPHIDNYDYASEPSLFDAQSHTETATSRDKFIDVFVKLPAANELLLAMAQQYIKAMVPKLASDGALLVCVSLSPLDKIGHIYGPFSREVIDMIYHLDKQILEFMQAIEQIIKPQDILYTLTADHGVMPIPELEREQYPQAGRIMAGDMVQSVNKYIKQKFGVSSIIRGHKMPHIYLDQKKLKKMTSKKRHAVKQAIGEKLCSYPGISAVFDAKKLAKSDAPIGSIAWLFKNNMYKGRSGDLFVLVAPHIVASKYVGGTKHYTPYACNTHVPLMLYQQGMYQHKYVKQKVWATQLAPTLASINGIKHTRHMLESLPGVF